MLSQLYCINTDKTYVLSHSPFRIGNTRGADIKCAALVASRNHCRLVRDSIGMWTVKVNGASKIYINKKELKAYTDHILLDGDTIQVGSVEENMAWKLEFINPVDRQQKALKLKLNSCVREIKQQKKERAKTKFQSKARAMKLNLIKKDKTVKPLLEKEHEHGKREDLGEKRCKQLQQKLMSLNKTKVSMEGQLINEKKKRKKAEEKARKLRRIVVAQQQKEAKGLVSVKLVEQLLESDLQCSVCAELFVTPMTLHCSHTFCETCLLQWKIQSCPFCRAVIKNQCRALALENCIDKVVQTLSEEFQQRRKGIIADRMSLKDQLERVPARDPSGRNRGSVRFNPTCSIRRYIVTYGGQTHNFYESYTLLE